MYSKNSVFDLFKSSLSLCFIILLSACSGEKEGDELRGRWVGIGSTSGVREFQENNVLIMDGKSERTYSLQDNIMKVKWLSFEIENQYAVSGDTLTIITPNRRDRFIRESALGPMKNRLADLIGKELRGKRIPFVGISLEETDFVSVKDSLTVDEKLISDVTDKEKVYVGQIQRGSKGVMQILVRAAKGNQGQLMPRWEETYESGMTRMLKDEMKADVIDVDLVQTPNKKNYAGKVTFAGNDQMGFWYFGERKWRPERDPESIRTFVELKMRQLYGDVVKDVKMETSDKVSYKGTLITADGSEMSFKYNSTNSLGWKIENTEENFRTLVKEVLTRRLGIETEIKSTETVSDTEYKVRAYIKEHDLTVDVFADINQGWYPVNDLENLAKVTKIQMTASLKDIDVKVSLTPVIGDNTRYTGVAEYTTGEVRKFELTHSGKQFGWKFVKG